MARELNYPKLGFRVIFRRIDDPREGDPHLRVTVVTPIEKVEVVLVKIKGLKERMQLMPGFAFFYHHLSKIEEAIIEATEHKG